MKRFLVTTLYLFTLTSLSSCAISSKTHTPSGKEAYAIDCSGSLLNWGMCYDKAGDICGSKGYYIVKKDEERGTYLGNSIISRSMTIRCKGNSQYTNGTDLNFNSKEVVMDAPPL